MKLSFLWERFYPQFLALFAALGYAYYFHRNGAPIYVPVKAPDLLGVGINVGGVAAAFIATIQGVILSMNANPLMKRLRELGVYEQLLRYFTSGIRWSFALTLLSVIGYFIPFEASRIPDWQRWAFLVWAAVGMIAALTCYRITSLFTQILHD